MRNLARVCKLGRQISKSLDHIPDVMLLFDSMPRTNVRLLLPKAELRLDTKCENQITNEINREPIRYGDRVMKVGLERDYPRGLHRPVGPSRKYNCHGLTFASRRTWISDAAEIKMILEDDSYEEVDGRVLPGDVAVYYKDGDTEHSGIVVRVDELNVPHILSKWGPCHEVVHHVAESPYDAKEVKYYRMKT